MILPLLTALLLHPVHETMAEVEWNAQTSRMEVALRLDVWDEQWLNKQSPPDADPAKAAVTYLATHFQTTDQPKFPGESVKRNAPNTPTYHWVGRKPDGPFVWWYFEIEMPTKKRPTWICQRMFVERDDRYTNRVIVLDQKPPIAITLTTEKTIARLDKPDDEPTVDDRTKEPKS